MLCRHKDNPTANSPLPAASTGEHGGSELHTTLVKNELLSRIEGMDLSKEERDQLLSSCMNDYRRWVLHNFSKDEFFVRGNHNNSSDTEASTFVFSKELSLEIYNKSFEGPLEALKKLLKSWAVKDGTTAIALTGGTFLNPHVRGEIRKFIKSKRKLEYISWAEDNAPAEGWYAYIMPIYGASWLLLVTFCFIGEAIF